MCPQVKLKHLNSGGESPKRIQIAQGERIAVRQFRPRYGKQLDAGRGNITQIHGTGSAEIETKFQITLAGIIAQVDSRLPPVAIIERFHNIRERLTGRVVAHSVRQDIGRPNIKLVGLLGILIGITG